MHDNILDIRTLSIAINHEPILCDINLEIRQGDFIFLKGINGSGKTSFLHAISLLTYDGKNTLLPGSVILFNHEYDLLTLPEKDSHKYRQQRHFIKQVEEDLGTVFDKFARTMDTILKAPLSKRDILDFFDTYNAWEYFPHQSMDALLKRKIKSLSEGQKKVILLLSGFMRAPYMKLLIVDEPLNHLDSSNIRKTIKIFEKLRADFPALAIIITTHCQAFPEPTKFLLIKDKHIITSPVPYNQYNCFKEIN